jgi:hypothetical protein
MRNRPESENPVGLYGVDFQIPDRGYRWVSGFQHPHDGKIDLVRSPDGHGFRTTVKDWLTGAVEHQFLIESEDTRSHWNKQPDQELYLEFAKLELKPEAILRFANKHGWLGIPKFLYSPEVNYSRVGGLHQLLPAGCDLRLQSAINEKVFGKPIVAGEGFYQWRYELRLYQTFFRIWEWATSKHYAALRSRIKWRDDGTGVHLKTGLDFLDCWITIEDDPAGLRMLPPGSLVEPAKAFVTEQVTTKLIGNVTTGLYCAGKAPDPFKIAIGLQPINLLTGIWMQFADLLTGKRIYKACEECGEWMDVSECAHKAAKRIHARCSRARRMRKWRMQKLQKCIKPKKILDARNSAEPKQR